ncbi:MAG: indole-3-glycerol phosphate synthase TrpC [Bacteroidales bacterium]|jgi:indole-3-glycerol phosphate synthase|nr:indole-3-glycerol phosphate synthase TrpC [Bacteroidales bacterium]
MKDILEEIVANKRTELAIAMNEMPLDVLQRLTQQRIDRDGRLKLRSMKQSLANSASGIIAEFKRKSPSRGWIHADVEPEQVVPLYAEGGAAASSILTDEKYFGGRLEFIQRVRDLVPDLPLLRKEFIVDAYQLYEARLVGADAVLLIAADLLPEQYGELLQTAHDLGLEVLLEVHDEAELSYLQAGVPDMLGVNNRSLGTFVTDVQHSFDIAARMQRSVRALGLSANEAPLLVSESGIGNPSVVRLLREKGFRGFLIGECFMKEANPGEALREFVNETLTPALPHDGEGA